MILGRRQGAEHGSQPRFRRGIAILPSLFTVANMFCGYSAIVAAARSDFELAVTLVIIAGFLDGLDGRIARMTNTSSEFGLQLDSLTDFLSFGIAPAMIYYHWGFDGLSGPAWLRPTAWLFTFLLPVAAGIRLARFNVQAHTADKRFFVGLAAPMAAGAAVLPLYYLPQGLPDSWKHILPQALASNWKYIALGYLVLLSWLMVSTVRYRSFKQFDFRQRRPVTIVFALGALIVAIAVFPKPVLLVCAILYASSGPIFWLTGKIRPQAHQGEAGSATKT